MSGFFLTGEFISASQENDEEHPVEEGEDGEGEGEEQEENEDQEEEEEEEEEKDEDVDVSDILEEEEL